MVKADLSKNVNYFGLTFGWGVMLVVVLLNLLVWVIVLLNLQQSRLQYEERAAVASNNLTSLLEQSIDDAIDKMAMALYSVNLEIDRQMAAGGIHASSLNAYMSHLHKQTSVCDGMRITDADGVVRYGMNVPEGSIISIASEDHFLYLRDHPDAGMVISKPRFGKISNKWTIEVARRYNRADGSFGGVIRGINSLEYFAKLFSGINSGSNGVVVLRDAQLGMIVRYPNSGSMESVIGIKNITNEFQKALEENPEHGTFTSISAVDGVQRINSFHKIGKLPLLVHVGLATDDYLVSWHREVRNTIVASLIFTLISCLMALILWRYWQARKIRMEALDENKKLFQAMAEMSSDWFWEQDNTFHFTRVSGSLLQLYGASSEHFVGKTRWEIALDISEADMSAHKAVVMSHQQFNDFEYSFYGLTGEKRSISVSGEPVYDAQGKFKGYRGTGKDITARKRAENALRESHEVHQSILETTLDGFWQIDHQGRFLEVNPAYCEISGYSREELLSMRISDLEESENPTETADRIQRLLKDGRDQFETKHRRKDGSIFDVEVSATFHNVSGGQIFAFIRDITERKVFETKLQHSEEHFRFVSESANAMIWMSNQEKLCTWFNKVWLDFTGRTLEQEYGNGWAEGVHPDDLSRCWEIYAGSFDRRQPFSMEYRLKRYDGAYRWLLDIGKPFFGVSGDFEGYLGSCFDITERKITEDVLRENHENLKSILETTMDGFWSADEHGNLLDVNPAYCKMSGYTHEELISMRISDLEEAMGISGIEDRIRHSFRYGSDQFETKHRRKNGSIWDVEVSITYRDILGGRLFVFMRDITERKRFQEELQEIATTDDLTGLINRRHFLELAQNEHRRAIRLHHDMALALVDIDHFKQINDTHGHAAGDRVLQILAKVFQKSIREIDVFARLGGDEFVLLLPGANSEQAYEVVERARLALASQDIYFGDQLVSITVSSGIASISVEEDTFELLMNRADHAMYKSKESGRNRVTIETDFL